MHIDSLKMLSSLLIRIGGLDALLHERNLVASAANKILRELFTYDYYPGIFFMQGSMGTTEAIRLGGELRRHHAGSDHILTIVLTDYLPFCGQPTRGQSYPRLDCGERTIN